MILPGKAKKNLISRASTCIQIRKPKTQLRRIRDFRILELSLKKEIADGRYSEGYRIAGVNARMFQLLYVTEMS